MKIIKLLLILIFSCTFCTACAGGEEEELRGMWIATVINIDFPKTEDFAAQREEIIKMLNRAQSLNMNAVMFQVRACADAFYNSQLVPWSVYLGGVPDYDPLAFIIEEAHKRNIELHAWFNPYRVSMNLRDAPPEGSVYYTHPEWIKTANSRYVVDPGIPEARRWVEDCVMEVVCGYDIDGVHFDDYFYYESEKSPLEDDGTFAAYGAGFENKADWRRNNTYLLVKELSEKIRAEKKNVKFGISPAGVWRNIKDDEEGSQTTAGLPNYDKAYADTRRWVREEIIDYIAPQIYWKFDTAAAPYGVIADWWANAVKGTNVQLYTGNALYRADEFGADEIIRQIEYNRSIGINGSIMFSAKQVEEYYGELLRVWGAKTKIPEFKGRGKAPEKPLVRYKSGNLTITAANEEVKYFCIYDKNGSLENIVRRQGETTEVQAAADSTVTAVNYNHAQSKRAKVKAPFSRKFKRLLPVITLLPFAY